MTKSEREALATIIEVLTAIQSNTTSRAISDGEMEVRKEVAKELRKDA